MVESKWCATSISYVAAGLAHKKYAGSDVPLILRTKTESGICDAGSDQGQGCNYCYNSGCRGRKVIYEILCVSPEIRKMTVNAGSDNAIAQQAIKEGMKTLRKSGIEQVLNGSTTFGKVADKVFRVVNEETKEPVESPIDKALRTGKTECGTEYDTLMSRKGTERPIAVSAAPIRNSEGAVVGTVVVIRDVSHEREIDRMKTDFTSSVSHELRTPLTSIKAYTATILRDPNMPEETKRQFLAIIDEESNRLASLIEDLLEVSRIESGTVKIRREPVDIIGVIEKVLLALEPLAEKKNIRLKTNIGDELPKFQADESKIESVITNLVNNAIKFTPEHSQVAICIKVANGEMVIRVSDTGMGIPKEALLKIFDRFYRIHRPGKQIQGTGLGLSIVNKIVTMHNGRIEVESEVEQGTTFTIFLPLSVKPIPEVSSVKEACAK